MKFHRLPVERRPLAVGDRVVIVGGPRWSGFSGTVAVAPREMPTGSIVRGVWLEVALDNGGRCGVQPQYVQRSAD